MHVQAPSGLGPVVVESISDQGAYASINVDSENKLYISHQYYQKVLIGIYHCLNVYPHVRPPHLGQLLLFKSRCV